MKIAGITRIRNEQDIIEDTLYHFEQYCNHGIYVYDDCSDDCTVGICESHEAVKKVIRGEIWDKDRTRAEWQTRQRILEEAQKDNFDWCIYFDADERLDFDWKECEYYMRSPDFNAVFMKLFDAYITEDDFHRKPYIDDNLKIYNDRKWFGPEFRWIGMFFRNTPILRYYMPDQRIATFDGNALTFGAIKHYGKAINIAEWEKTCDYYIEHFPEPYKQKWRERKGKAIHNRSDFGRELIKWEDIEKKGILLNE